MLVLSVMCRTTPQPTYYEYDMQTAIQQLLACDWVPRPKGGCFWSCISGDASDHV